MKQEKENLLYDLAYQVCDVNKKRTMGRMR